MLKWAYPPLSLQQSFVDLKKIVILSCDRLTGGHQNPIGPMITGNTHMYFT